MMMHRWEAAPTCKHGELADVVEGAQPLASKRTKQVTNKYLCTLVEEHLQGGQQFTQQRPDLLCLVSVNTAGHSRAACSLPLRAQDVARTTAAESSCTCLLLEWNTAPAAHLPALVNRVVPKPRQVCRYQLHQGHCRLLCCCHQLSCLAVEVLPQHRPNLQQQIVRSAAQPVPVNRSERRQVSKELGCREWWLGVPTGRGGDGEW